MFFGATQQPNGSVKSIQRGTITFGVGAGTATATISSVNIAKTNMVFLGFSEGTLGSDSAAFLNAAMPRLNLTDATTVTVTRAVPAPSNGASKVSFEVVEWY